MTTPDKNKVSVVLTTYNRGRALERTVQSILAQSYRDFELVISDDCSTDDTPAICAELQAADSRIRYRRNETNLKMPGNLNAGIRASKGEFIANVHDGDIYDPDLLEEWKGALERAPNAAFVFNAYKSIDTEGRAKTIYDEVLPPVVPGKVLLEKLFFRRWRFGSPVWGTVMARRSAYEEMGYFDEHFGFVSDVDMWLRLAERYDVAYVQKALIGLPEREDLPCLCPYGFFRKQKQLERMFLNARLRHYKMPSIMTELARHSIYSVMCRTYLLLCALNERRKGAQLATS